MEMKLLIYQIQMDAPVKLAVEIIVERVFVLAIIKVITTDMIMPIISLAIMEDCKAVTIILASANATVGDVDSRFTNRSLKYNSYLHFFKLFLIYEVPQYFI